jgi:DNA (cytosine-5)-methyltransferase 1
MDDSVSTMTLCMKHVDLFAGTGAFSQAFRAQGVTTVFANDMLESSKAIYDANAPSHTLTCRDLCDIAPSEIPAHDILTGGFPCQPFSVAGRREGFRDPRSNVFYKITEILDHHTPACVILENVKNLTTHDSGTTFKFVLSELEARGYHVKYQVLNTAQITGVPQHRERIYIVGIRDTTAYDAFTLDFPDIPKQPVSALLDATVPDKYYYTQGTKAWDLVGPMAMEPDTVYQYRRVYIRENKSGECPTLTANMGHGGHNVPLVIDAKGKRKLTPRECFRFQGFPDSFVLPPLSDSKLYALAGNAVSLPVVERIASRLVPLLKMPSNVPR